MSVACLVAMAQPPENLSIFDPVSPSGESIRDLAFLVLAITGVIFLIVEGILLYAVFRFRTGAPKGGSEPPQVYGSTPIEIAWTAAPALVVLILTLVITRTLWEVSADPHRPPKDSRPVRVRVIGHQFWWEYVYEDETGKPLFITANELRVPASDLTVPSLRRPVYLTLQAADVCHSFWVPRLGGKTDLIPGRTNIHSFETDQAGLYLGQCAEFCGVQHAKMLLRVYVDPPDEFARWMENEKKPAVDDPTVADGKERFLVSSCVSCHRVRGTSAAGSFGPDLTHLMSRQTLASGMMANTSENLRDWIADPQKLKPGCLMPAFGRSEGDQKIVDYLLTLK